MAWPKYSRRIQGNTRSAQEDIKKHSTPSSKPRFLSSERTHLSVVKHVRHPSTRGSAAHPYASSQPLSQPVTLPTLVFRPTKLIMGNLIQIDSTKFISLLEENQTLHGLIPKKEAPWPLLLPRASVGTFFTQKRVPPLKARSLQEV